MEAMEIVRSNKTFLPWRDIGGTMVSGEKVHLMTT